MSKNEIYLLILGMALVTYLPRAIPVFLTEKFAASGRIKKFFSLLPYTAMAALIFPGILSVDSEHPIFGIVGGITAALLALKKYPLVICVLGAVAVNYILYLI